MQTIALMALQMSFANTAAGNLSHRMINFCGNGGKRLGVILGTGMGIIQGGKQGRTKDN